MNTGDNATATAETEPSQPPATATTSNKQSHNEQSGGEDVTSTVGQVGYTFLKQFGTDWFTGSVFKILETDSSSQDRRCVYEDDDIEDLSIAQLEALKEEAKDRVVGEVPKDVINNALVLEAKNWEMAELIPLSMLNKPDAPKCEGETDEGQKCTHSAFCIWKGTDPDNIMGDCTFRSCVDCSDEYVSQTYIAMYKLSLLRTHTQQWTYSLSYKDIIKAGKMILCRSSIFRLNIGNSSPRNVLLLPSSFPTCPTIQIQ